MTAIIIACTVGAVWLAMYGTGTYTIYLNHEDFDDERTASHRAAAKIIVAFTLAGILASIPFILVLHGLRQVAG